MTADMREATSDIDSMGKNEGEGANRENAIVGNSENNDVSNFTDNTCIVRKGKDLTTGCNDNPFDELFASRDAVFQGSFQIVGISKDDVDHTVPLPEGEGKDGWEIIGRCRCGRLNSVISISRYRNPVIWLRTRVLNQEGLASEPSEPLVFKLSNI